MEWRMVDIVTFLVFSVVMLLFMAYPAIKIVEFLSKKYSSIEGKESLLTLLFTIILSLMVGAFLRYL
jgi:hypothetical protein